MLAARSATLVFDDQDAGHAVSPVVGRSDAADVGRGFAALLGLRLVGGASVGGSGW